MIITLSRTGGVTGIPLKKTIDTSTLPKDEAKELESGIMNQQLWQAQESVSEDKQLHRDTFTYTLSIQQAQNKVISSSITLPEHLLTPKIQTLIGKLLQM